MHIIPLVGILIAAVSTTPILKAQSQILRFDDVSADLGVVSAGNSFGAGAWGDFDGDRRPDLWVGNHANRPELYWNTANLGLVDIAPLVWPGLQHADTHGATWADFDRDGDLDLLELVGARGGNASLPNQFWLNHDLQLQEYAQQIGLDYPTGRGRTPLWLDWNHDGRLDVLLANLFRRSISYTLPLVQTPPDPEGNSNFELDWPNSGFKPPIGDVGYTQLADLNDDGQLDLVVQGRPFPLAVYDMSVQPMVDILPQLQLPTTTWVRDSVLADFNGDLKNDLYLARYPMDGGSEAVLKGTNRLHARLLATRGELGFKFVSSGELMIYLFDIKVATKVFIGSSGWNPTVTPFSLSPNDSRVVGMPSYAPGVDRGLFIGFEPVSETWTIMLSTPGRNDFSLRLESTSDLKALQEIGFDSSLVPEDRLLFQGPNSFVNGAIAEPVSGQSVVAGDFDNDMDLDLYVVVSGSALNQENVLYANQGGGNFVVVPGAGSDSLASGAAGTDLGIGDSVAMADYDMDGFLDLFVTNGEGFGAFAAEGPQQIFRNVSAESGNTNHWLEIDLEGVADNRDAIGARVVVQAGGIRQVREQNGGMHRFTQNHSRLHFGLANFDRVEALEVQWPNGQNLVLLDLPVDRLLHIQQTAPTFQPGAPDLSAVNRRAAYLWKETFDGPYRLLLSAAQRVEFEANLVGDQPIMVKRQIGTENPIGADWQVFSAGFHWLQDLQDEVAAVDFWLPPQSSTWLSIAIDQHDSNYQLAVGKSLEFRGAEGWLLHTSDLIGLPDPIPGAGLTLRADSSGTVLSGVWDGPGGLLSQASLRCQFSVGLDSARELDLESGDLLQADLHWATIEGEVDTNWDGVRLRVPRPQWFAWQYVEDGLIAPHRVQLEQPNRPNAVQIPLCTPYGEPEWVAGSDHQILIWKNVSQNSWSVRFNVPPGGPRKLQGILRSDERPLRFRPVDLESSDVLRIDQNGLAFDFEAVADFDGFDVWLPEGATVSFELSQVQAEQELIRVGQSSWPITALPLSLSGW
jgi:ASPIC and UnbV/FG-GAP-like repeat